jgi:hypothetical protein
LKSRIHLAIAVHRMDGLPTGLYLLVRDPAQTTTLQAALTQADPSQRPPGCPSHWPLYCLIEADARAAVGIPISGLGLGIPDRKAESGRGVPF